MRQNFNIQESSNAMLCYTNIGTYSSRSSIQMIFSGHVHGAIFTGLQQPPWCFETPIQLCHVCFLEVVCWTVLGGAVPPFKWVVFMYLK